MNGNTSSDSQVRGEVPQRQQQIAQWLVDYVADLVRREPSEIDDDVPLSRYGVDSVTAVEISGALEEWLGTEVDPALAYDYPTIRELSTHVAGLVQARSDAGSAS